MLAGQPFNLNSPKQIQEILFVKQGIKPVKKTPTGAPSTDEDALEQLAQDHPLPKLLLEYRGIAKLKSTYTDKLPRMVNPDTGRVHTNYAQAVAITGRLASNDPNLQNIPIRTAEGRRIREAFIPVLTIALNTDGARSLFDGRYVVDEFSLTLKALFLIAGYVVVLMSQNHVEEGDYYQGEFYVLLLTSTLGMMIMAGARDLITIFVALETISIPTFVLAGWRKHDVRSNEAAVKYFIIGVLSSAVMLYGMSLLYGTTHRGVYVSFDRGGQWQPLQLNLPPVAVNDVTVLGDDLVVATWGRAIWALGVTARDGKDAKHRDWARTMFDRTASLALELGSLRAQSFAMLGAAAMLETSPGHELARSILERFPDDHLALLAAARRPEWRWFEIVLAYDNARLPQALVVAGQALGRQDLIDCGLETLDWIVAKQTSPEGRFRAVGTESFHRPYADPLQFDQQPLEAQATIDACAAAFDATGDRRWFDEAKRAYDWYLGANDLDLPLASLGDGGCFDGLMPSGLNRNQGAESILALQMASCAISGLSKRVEKVAGTGVHERSA